MIKQLRPFHTPEYLNELYSQPHNHHLYGRGHHIRVELTKFITLELFNKVGANSAADLSCGNGEIVKSLPTDNIYLGDFAPGYRFTGPIHETITQIPNVGVYVCSETLEHVEKPLETLKSIRPKSNSLVLSTPLDKWDDSLAEHYWAWDREGVEGLLTEAGWEVVTFVMFGSTVVGEPYKYGIWGCV